MKYYSDMTKKLYDTVEELKAAEKIENKKLEDAKALKEKREARAKEVEAAFEEAKNAEERANKLLKEFTKDYGNFHMTLKGNSNFFDNFLLTNFNLF